MATIVRGSPAVDTSSRPYRDEGEKRIAAIDIGSNSIRQIVADVSPTGAIRVVDEMKAAPRLGAGLAKSGRLEQGSIIAATDAVTRMVTLARHLGVKRVEAVATSAVRDAENGAEFVEAVKKAIGLKVKLLKGEEEARLSWVSAIKHFDLGIGRAVVMDIGGGSLELALSADGLLERLVSVPFGTIRMSEKFLSPDATFKRVRKLRKFVRDDIRRILPVRDWRGARVIGSGGTFTNLAGMLLARQGVQTARSVHGTRIVREDLEHILDTLQEMTAEERSQVPGLNPARADIIVAGLAVAAEVMARLESRALFCSAYGIREGLLLEVAKVTPSVTDPGEARERSVREFAERCRFEAPHARQVQRLALQLYDALGPRLGCEPGDRQVLADAALLHDIGYHINYDKHHKHSYHLILHADLLGMTPTEQVLVANIARYHRGAPPKKTHENLAGLSGDLRKKIRKLSAILRLADGLDRGHVGGVADVKVRWLQRAIRIHPTPIPKAVLRLELWGAARKSALLADVAGVPVEVVGADGKPVEVRTDEGDGD
ncbi:MAG: Ppx/GppA family phosphatase [Gemmatimonadetes bacterium]|nr:Ppx/GppA family phosphatase [Gemmatimonadota bacterium]